MRCSTPTTAEALAAGIRPASKRRKRNMAYPPCCPRGLAQRGPRSSGAPHLVGVSRPGRVWTPAGV
eukprot:13771077-Alexandrium_andersonii.AAC.1